MPESPEFHFVTGRAEQSSPPLLLLHGSGGDVSAHELPARRDLHQDEADIIRDWLIRKGI